MRHFPSWRDAKGGSIVLACGLKHGGIQCDFPSSRPARSLQSLYFVPAQAVAAPAYACSVAEIFECTPVAGCQRVSAQQANLPPFVTLNVKQKQLFSGLFGGQGLFDPGDAYEDQQVLILHGRHGLLTWTAVVAKDTGQMSMSIANLGKTFAQFGHCTPQQ